MTHPARILVVDDDPASLEATVRPLESAGYKVDRCTDGEGLLTRLRSLTPEVLLLSRDPTRTDSLDLCRGIRDDPGLSGVLLVLTSALAVRPDEQADGLDAGAEGYLTRPISDRELLSRVAAFARLGERLAGPRPSAGVPDITARRLADEALTVSALALKAISQGIVVCGQDQRILSVNDAFVAITGYSAEEAKGRNCSFLQGPLSDPETIAAIGRALGAEEEFRGEIINYRKDGSPFWNEFAILPARDARGVLTRFIGVIRDITKRKEAQQALIASEARSRAVIEASLIPMALNDDAQRITFLNPAFVETFGYGRTDIPTLSDWWPKAYPDPGYRKWAVEAWEAELACARQTGTSFRPIEFTIRCKDGTDRSALISAAPLSKDLDGTHLVLFSDITERKKAEAALRASERRYRSILEAEPECVKLVAANGELLEMNPAGLTMLEAGSVEEVRAKGLVAFVLPDHREAFLALHRQAINGVPGLLEFEVEGLRGTRRWLETHAAPMPDEGGKGTLMLGVTRDVTARRESARFMASMQEHLRQSQKMEAIGTLASGIAHDFNNIVAIILGNAEITEPYVARSPEAAESLAEIVKAASRARELVRQILSFSRREPMRRERVDVMSIVNEATSLLRATLPSSVVIETRGPASQLLASVDAVQIEQVLINLASNAAQAFTEGTGRVGIAVEAVNADETLILSAPALRPVLERTPGPVLRLTVTDDGPGMNKETLARIFEPFFTTKSPGEGTGLGLSVVHGIIRGHGGVILAQSEPGQGATFTIYLPLAENEEERKRAEEAKRASGETAVPGRRPSIRLLYIDDTAPLLRATRSLLERRGYRVTALGDPNEAIEAVRADPGAFDLVLTDHNMPTKSGIELAREVRAIREDLPVALLSGFVDDALRARAEEAGVREVILKAGFSDLFAALKRLTE